MGTHGNGRRGCRRGRRSLHRTSELGHGRLHRHRRWPAQGESLDGRGSKPAASCTWVRRALSRLLDRKHLTRDRDSAVARALTARVRRHGVRHRARADANGAASHRDPRLASLDAVQLQPAAVVTVTDPVPPVLEKLARVGEIAYVHAGGGGGGGGGAADTILLMVPPSPTTYSSPLSSSPNDEIFSAVSSNTDCDGPPVQPKISPEQ